MNEPTIARHKHTVPPPVLCHNAECYWKARYVEEETARLAVEVEHQKLKETLKKLRLQLIKRVRPVEDDDREAAALEKHIESRNAARYEELVRDERVIVSDTTSGRRRRE